MCTGDVRCIVYDGRSATGPPHASVTITARLSSLIYGETGPAFRVGVLSLVFSCVAIEHENCRFEAILRFMFRIALVGDGELRCVGPCNHNAPLPTWTFEFDRPMIQSTEEVKAVLKYLPVVVEQATFDL